MNSGSIQAAAGIIGALVAVIALLLTVRSASKKSQAKLQDDFAEKYKDGIKEGERRMQSKIDRLDSQLELRTSERDQARSDLGEWRNDHRDRRGRE